MSPAVVNRPLTRQEQEQQARALMERAVIHVQVYYCFYGALLARLKLKQDWRHPTMYTDAVVIGYSPEFVLSETWDHLVYILIHEVTHCALGHPFRRGDREPKLWNQAIDHVTNLSLNRDPELKRMFQGSGGLADERFAGMAGEQVYAILKQERDAKQQQQKQQPEPQQGAGEGDDAEELSGASGMAGDCLDAGASGEPLPDDDEDDDEVDAQESDNEQEEDDEQEDDGDESDGDDLDGDIDGDELSEQEDSGDDADIDVKHGQLDDAQLAQLEQEWAEASMTAQLAAGGDVDAAVLRQITESNTRVKSFEEHVDDFANRTCNQEESWARGNRRFADTYLPARCAPGVQVMVVGIDTSGSIGAEALDRMQTASQHIMRDFGLKELHVVYCDSAIRGIEVFTQGEDVVFSKLKGGGGTAFHPVLRYAVELQQQGEDVAGVIYLTDMMGGVRDPEDFQHLEILWVNAEPKLFGDYEAPAGLGTVVDIE